MPVDHLLGAVRVALAFDDQDDPESIELHALLRSGATAHALTEILTGLMESHPLFPAVRDVVAEVLQTAASRRLTVHRPPAVHGCRRPLVGSRA